MGCHMCAHVDFSVLSCPGLCHVSEHVQNILWIHAPCCVSNFVYTSTWVMFLGCTMQCEHVIILYTYILFLRLFVIFGETDSLANR